LRTSTSRKIPTSPRGFQIKVGYESFTLLVADDERIYEWEYETGIHIMDV
jgi:hypothetical protein